MWAGDARFVVAPASLHEPHASAHESRTRRRLACRDRSRDAKLMLSLTVCAQPLVEAAAARFVFPRFAVFWSDHVRRPTDPPAPRANRYYIVTGLPL